MRRGSIGTKSVITAESRQTDRGGRASDGGGEEEGQRIETSGQGPPPPNPGQQSVERGGLREREREKKKAVEGLGF